jgi:RHS repeat-associated protein
VSTYTYEIANRLSSVTQGTDTYSFTYNGLGDRLQQTVNAQTTTYTLDLNTGLTQVLSDGTSSYLYGLGRIAEEDTEWAYYLTDALGSVRQLTSNSAGVTLTQNYEPYGDVLATVGETDSNYGFTGEWTDGTGLQHLRARYLDTGVGSFISRDTFPGFDESPISYHKWLYAYGNPINKTDPSGLSAGATGYSGLDAFVMCFDLHSLTKGLLPINEGMMLQFYSAQDVIDICNDAYNKNNWDKDFFNLEEELPTSAHNLMGWFLYEVGSQHLVFDANEPLTQELARSAPIQRKRLKFYREGDLPLTEENFGHFEFMESIIFDSFGSIEKESLPISFFWGHFGIRSRILGIIR